MKTKPKKKLRTFKISPLEAWVMGVSAAFVINQILNKKKPSTPLRGFDDRDQNKTMDAIAKAAGFKIFKREDFEKRKKKT